MEPATITESSEATKLSAEKKELIKQIILRGISIFVLTFSVVFLTSMLIDSFASKGEVKGEGEEKHE